MYTRRLVASDRRDVEAIFDLYWSDSFRTNLKMKLDGYLTDDPVLQDQHFTFVVAENEGEVVGVAAYRKAPEHMRRYCTTDNPVEFYVAAAKRQGEGIGNLLRDARIEAAKKSGYTEIVFFSGVSHKDSWYFHDSSVFEKVSEANAPNGESGYVWRTVLQ